MALMDVRRRVVGLSTTAILERLAADSLGLLGWFSRQGRGCFSRRPAAFSGYFSAKPSYRQGNFLGKKE
jgi:hypothetical protein